MAELVADLGRQFICFCFGECHGRRHGGSRVGNRPPWKKSGWAWPTLEILAVVRKLPGNSLSMKV